MSEVDRAQADLDEQQGLLDRLPADLVRRFSEMALMLPETESDSGAGIIEAILGAVDVHDLDAPWDTKDPDALIGQWLIITDATRSMSTYKESLGVFLVITAVQEDTGEEITFTTGSMSIVAQVVKAYAQDMLPLRAKLVRAEKPTASGYWPQHLVVHDKQPAK